MKTCQTCKDEFNESEMIKFADDYVCIGCKEVYVQTLKEGGGHSSKEKVVRLSSIATAAAYLLVGGICAYVIPRFDTLYTEMEFSQHATLSRLVFAFGPLGYLLLAFLMALFIFGKDFSPPTRNLPNWPFMILLALMCIMTALGAFMPMIVTIERL